MLIKNPSKKTKDYFKTYFKFDPTSETNFRWARNRGKKMKEGDTAGTINPDGYVVLSDGEYGKVLGHNVAYFLKNGNWPKKYQADTFRKEFEKTVGSTIPTPLEGLDEMYIYESREDALWELSDQMDYNYLLYSDQFYSKEELDSVAKTSYDLSEIDCVTNDEGDKLYSGNEVVKNNLLAFTDLLDQALPWEVFYY